MRMIPGNQSGGQGCSGAARRGWGLGARDLGQGVWHFNGDTVQRDYVLVRVCTSRDIALMTINPPTPIPSPAPSLQPPVPPLARIAVCLATGLGICLRVPAPGTVGTALFGLPLAWAIGQLPGIGWQLVAIAVAVLVGIPMTTAANRALGAAKDHQAIVWDEIASMPIVFLLVPLANWKTAIAGFALHRFFDILKPPPARQLERLPEGLGIMADDLMAAVYACAALGLFSWLDGQAGLALLATIRG
jgi:phosphatidylglycerophosphatase A